MLVTDIIKDQLIGSVWMEHSRAFVFAKNSRGRGCEGETHREAEWIWRRALGELGRGVFKRLAGAIVVGWGNQIARQPTDALL